MKKVSSSPSLPEFISSLQRRDPELYEIVSRLMEKAMGPGALDQKTKTLIALALDASHGAVAGVKVLADRARQLGSTEAEIAEALRLAYFVSGNGILVTSMSAYEGRS